MDTIRFFTDANCVGACELIDARQRVAEANQFEVRMFLVDIGNGQVAWYGSLQNVKKGEPHYFRGWSGLVANLQRILSSGAQLEILKTFAPLAESAH